MLGNPPVSSQFVPHPCRRRHVARFEVRLVGVSSGHFLADVAWHIVGLSAGLCNIKARHRPNKGDRPRLSVVAAERRKNKDVEKRMKLRGHVWQLDTNAFALTTS